MYVCAWLMGRSAIIRRVSNRWCISCLTRDSQSQIVIGQIRRYLHNLFVAQTELSRLDRQHIMWRLLLDDDLHKAPLKQPKHVLDLGTGSGIWAMDFGELLVIISHRTWVALPQLTTCGLLQPGITQSLQSSAST
jgi:hypothetical protein